jgi:hypothetical protein
VARWYLLGVVATNLHFSAVLDFNVPTKSRAKMPDLTGSRADLGRDVSGPPSPGLEFHSADGRFVEVDDGHAAATQVAHLLRGS